MKRPASCGQHCRMGKSREREVVALNHFLARAGGNGLGKKLSHLGQHGEHFYFVEDALRGLHVHEDADAVGDFVQGVHAQGKFHAGF